MAFFGIEVKPGKPFIHQPLNSRLHLSLANLGTGSGTKKSIVQCNVGNKSPVILCCLLPDVTESCQLNVEFEEAHEVVFSVIGPRSVHLCGFYMSNASCNHPNDESESFGEDIGDTDTERSDNCEESEYGGSFIDDDEPQIIPSSPDCAQLNEEIFELKESKDGKRTRRRLRKKYQLSESENDDGSQQKVFTSADTAVEVLESEFEDALPISSLFRGRPESIIGTVNVLENASKVADNVDNNKTEDNVDVLERTNGATSIQPKSESDVKIQGEKKVVLDGDKGTPKKKIKQDKFPEAVYGMIGLKLNQKLANNDESGTRNQEEKKLVLGGEEKFSGMIGLELNQKLASNEEGKLKQNLEDGAKLKRKRKVQVGEKTAKNNVAKENEGHRICSNIDAIMHDVHVKEKETQEQVSEKKQKRKKRHKNKDDGDATKMELPLYENASEKSFQLPNGIIIEETEMGKPDGKIASVGKKVRFHYTGKLKASGEVFDSNAGKAPLKFRLGGEEVPDVWNAGLDGMRVGSKRRLTVPPSVSYRKGASENIPPNSWLVFDVELVKVR